MTEKLLHFIWRFQYFNKSDLRTVCGDAIDIIHAGQHNHHQGPDFLQARIRIGSTMLAGSVELHLKTSDWQRHGHSQDTNYQGVVLHVVYQHDNAVNNLPVLELQPRISFLLLAHYERLMQATGFIACGAAIVQANGLSWLSWKERLLAERLHRKAAQLLQPIEENKSHWEEGLWRMLARSFGAKTNADAFEAIAQSLPLKIIAKHKSSIHQIEAVLFGQARMLSPHATDDYPKMLLREYRFLQQKYGLVPIAVPVHFLRMRPPNFPTVRLAQLAALLHQSTHLFSKLLDAKTLDEISAWLQATANDYWHYHYRFDEATAYQPKKIGADMVQHIIINVAAPVLYAYGSYHKQAIYTERAVQLLAQLPSEKNKITAGFENLGIKAAHAGDAQALLELKNNYCNERRCLECAVGAGLLKRTAT